MLLVRDSCCGGNLSTITRSRSSKKWSNLPFPGHYQGGGQRRIHHVPHRGRLGRLGSQQEVNQGSGCVNYHICCSNIIGQLGVSSQFQLLGNRLTSQSQHNERRPYLPHHEMSTSLCIPSIAIFCYVFLHESWGLAWAVGNCTISPTPDSIFQKNIQENQAKEGMCKAVFKFLLFACYHSYTVRIAIIVNIDPGKNTSTIQAWVSINIFYHPRNTCECRFTTM